MGRSWLELAVCAALVVAATGCGNKDSNTGRKAAAGSAPGVRTIAVVTPKNRDPAGPLNGFVRVAQGEYELAVVAEGDRIRPTIKVDLEFLKEGEEPPSYALAATLRLNLVDSSGKPIRAGQGEFIDEMDLAICDHEVGAWKAALAAGNVTRTLRFCSPQTYAPTDDSYAKRAVDVAQIWVSTAPKKPAVEQDL